MPKPLNVLEGESVEEFDALCANFHSEHKPATETERFLVEMMIQHEWLMRRAVRMQQALLATVSNEADADPKRMNLVVRYFRTHEKAGEQAKRQLDSLRKHRRKTEKLTAPAIPRVTPEARRQQRQWEQILKKMPTLTSWVN